MALINSDGGMEIGSFPSTLAALPIVETADIVISDLEECQSVHISHLIGQITILVVADDHLGVLDRIPGIHVIHGDLHEPCLAAVPVVGKDQPVIQEHAIGVGQHPTVEHVLADRPVLHLVVADPDRQWISPSPHTALACGIVQQGDAPVGQAIRRHRLAAVGPECEWRVESVHGRVLRARP